MLPQKVSPRLLQPMCIKKMEFVRFKQPLRPTQRRLS
jgi:hypothetical protein